MLSGLDEELIEAARALIRARFRAGWHEVGCALRVRGGKVYTGVNVDCSVGRIAVCAEAIAIGRAATDGDWDRIETIVAVKQDSVGQARAGVIFPCGMCREMIGDYAPRARIIVPGARGPRLADLAELLPRRSAGGGK